MLGQLQDFDEAAHTEKLYQERNDTGHDHRRKNRIDQVVVLTEKERTGLKAMNGKGAQQDRGYGVSRNAKGQQRDHGAANGSVIRGFRGHNTVNDAGPEFLRILGAFLGNTIGHDIGRSAANARQDADPGSDQRRAEHVGDLSDEFLLAESKALDVRIYIQDLDFSGRLGLRQQFLQRIQANQCGNAGKTRFQAADSKSKARVAVDRSRAKAAEEHTDRAAHKTLCDGLSGQAGHQGECKQGHRGVFIHTKFQCHLCQQRRNKDHDCDSEYVSDQGVEGTRTQRLPGLPVLCHWRTIERGSHRRRRTRNIDQDCGHQAARNTSNIERDQKRKRCRRIHSEGKRKAQGNGHCPCKSRDCSENQSHHDAQQNIQQDHRRHNLS